MPIRKTHPDTDPFLVGESAVKALGGYVDGTEIARGGMYLLQIINTYIHEGKEILKRVPSEVLGGCPDGGRRHVQASALLRAVSAPGGEEQDDVLPSGYTFQQEVLGGWAERDGCWSDTPDGDQVTAGRRFLTSGSEAFVYKGERDSRVWKTIAPTHYKTVQQLLDRITIHNAVFPETAMRVEGFGVKEDAYDHYGFVVVVSQPWVTGTAPTQEEIDEGMRRRGFTEPEESGGFGFLLSPSGMTLLNDIHDLNSVKTPQGWLAVFDCVAAPNVFGLAGKRHVIPDVSYNPEAVERIRGTVESLLPLETGMREFFEAVPPPLRGDAVRMLKETGRCDGLIPVPGTADPDARLSVQLSPRDEDRVLVTTPEKIRRMLRLTRGQLDNLTPLTAEETVRLASGKPVRRGDTRLLFDLDKGRVITRIERVMRKDLTRQSTIRI